MGELVPLRRPQGWARDRRLWWLLWASCPGVGWVTLRAIEAHFGSLEAAWAAPLGAFPALPCRGRQTLDLLDRFRRRWGATPLERWAEQVRGGRRVLLPGDRAAPPQLGELERPPLALHWQGRGSLWACLGLRQSVAVVGTRRPSRHGLAMAEALGRALAAAGWPVVSGLAEGIDAACHRGCLAVGGRPVAVLGTPLERVYPRHHTSLQRDVGAQGLLLTEHLPGASVLPGHFASRNRLQVALARAVVVVECPERSGALHSARLAWRQQLPLWVVPADALRASAKGSNRLLGEGASALLDPSDLVHQLGPGPLAPGSAASGATAVMPAPGDPEADPELLRALGERATLDQLSQQLRQPAGSLAQRLLALELAGLVRAEPGLHWSRV
ncbi:DNA-processing protein DprA [Cyanobium sp. CH-040]|uniref:DNA-processing protein DprA n=1 Tax=Cyanobium sp. CH-040 TaxID=2823708 RepID=UPI0020CBFD4E|nr:DNA-processing protein DprA [Cyanobium sp. CH-040]MCP9929107.1 DNA-protecting protein DprA [Cyanobium sp. CH-040]